MSGKSIEQGRVVVLSDGVHQVQPVGQQTREWRLNMADIGNVRDAEVKQTQVVEQLARLEMWIGQALEAGRTLGERLRIVLRDPLPPNEKKADEQAAQMVPLAGDLRVLADRVAALNAVLNDIIKRLEL